MTSGQARAVASTFRRLGIPAVLDPEGIARPVRVMPWQQDETLRYEGLAILGETGVFEMLAAEFEGFGDAALLQIGAERRVVQLHRFRDARRLVVRLDTVPA